MNEKKSDIPNYVEVENVKKRKKSKLNNKIIIISIIVIVLLFIIGTALILTVFNNNWKEANNSYKTAYEIASKYNDELSSLINDSEKLVYSEKNALDETLKPALETAISEAKAAKKELPRKPPLFIKEINVKIEEIKQINYEKEKRNLQKKYNDLDKSIKQYELVDNPTEEYVVKSLKKISSIIDISAATEENDPNGKLNKQGGYTAQVYFSSKYIKQSEIYGDTLIDKGTDAGGSIEVYTTEDDANKRESYLSSFDGTVLASGSHKVIGTVLIRTSNELTATKQKELETNIVAALIGENVKEETAKKTKETEKKKKESSKSKVKQSTEPKYYSVVGTYSGSEGTIHFYANGTLHMDAIELGENIDGEVNKKFNIDGTWTQNGNSVYCEIYDDDGGSWTPQTVTVNKNGLSGWWGKYYNKK